MLQKAYREADSLVMHALPGARFITALAALGILLASPAEVFALRVNARQAGVYDLAAGEWIYSKSADKPVPVASITKVVAALTFVRLTDELDQLVTITREDWTRAGKTRLRVGDKVPARTLLRLAQIGRASCRERV